MEEQRSPGQAYVIKLGIKMALRGVHTCMPAVVTKYDEKKQTAECQPLFLSVYEDAADGARKTLEPPPIPNVPVIFPGGGGFRQTFPVLKGDVMKLEFTEAALDRWFCGNDDKPVDPFHDRRFDFSDAIGTPGLHRLNKPWANVPNDHSTWGADDGLQIHLYKDKLCLTKEHTNESMIALADKVMADLNALKTALAGWVVVPGDGGAALKLILTNLFAGTLPILPTPPPPWPQDVASAKVSSE